MAKQLLSLRVDMPVWRQLNQLAEAQGKTRYHAAVDALTAGLNMSDQAPTAGSSRDAELVQIIGRLLTKLETMERASQVSAHMGITAALAAGQGLTKADREKLTKQAAKVAEKYGLAVLK